jgi:hypothetical protein
LTTYSYCGYSLTSNISIPELSRSKLRGGWFSFTLEPVMLENRDFFRTGYRENLGSKSFPAYGCKDSKHWLRFPNLADFEISASARKITCFPVQELPADTICHLLLDQVLPRCMAHQGRIMLHASAVQLSGGVVLLIGDSGTGKSTLAANFQQAGNPVLSDDCIWVKESKEQLTTVPSYKGLRLWNDSLEVLFGMNPDTYSMAHYSNKKRIYLEGDEHSKKDDDHSLRATIVLSPLKQGMSSEISLERLSQSETFISILRQTFQLNLWDQEGMRKHMLVLGKMVPMFNAFRLMMPHEYTLLPQIRKKVLAALENEIQTTP